MTRIIFTCFSKPHISFTFINAVKTITSRKIQRNFPDVKIELWKGKSWPPSYFLVTEGSNLNYQIAYTTAKYAVSHWTVP